MANTTPKKISLSSRMVSLEVIEQKIYFIRGREVMIDRDLAQFYCVETRVLNQAVKRNIERFPDDFMFQMTKSEFEKWRSQIVTSNKEKMGLRRRPFVFTEQGVAMLSSVLKSKKAIQINIVIMRTFTKLRNMIATHLGLRNKIEELEKQYDKQFQIVFAAIRELLDKFKNKNKPKKPIGFHILK